MLISSVSKVPPVLAALVSLLFSMSVQAERMRDLGDYEVHYNTLNTRFLSPEVASQYGIIRSGHRAMLNVSVLKKTGPRQRQAVTARVSARSTNLAGQGADIPLREIREGNAIYYIGEFHIQDAQTLNFTVRVLPEGQKVEHTIHFRQQFYVE